MLLLEDVFALSYKKCTVLTLKYIFTHTIYMLAKKGEGGLYIQLSLFLSEILFNVFR